jgi:hypothetical protein
MKSELVWCFYHKLRKSAFAKYSRALICSELALILPKS